MQPTTIRKALDKARRVDEGFLLTADASWLQGRSWYGGLQMALALEALRHRVGPDIPLRSLHVTFFGPVADEPALAEAEVLRAGRSVTHGRARITQGRKICFECTAIFGIERPTSIDLRDRHRVDIGYDDLKPDRFETDLRPAFTGHYDMCWVAGDPPYSGSESTTQSIAARPAARAAMTEVDFVALMDVIPSPVIAVLDEPAPASSMNCAIEMIRPERVIGRHAWCHFDVTLHDSHSGYAWHTAQVFDETGVLVAATHQSVAVFG